MDCFEPVLSLFDVFALLLELCHQFGVVLLGLVEGLFETSVSRLHPSDFLLDVFEFVETGIEYVGEMFALLLNMFAFLLEGFEGECECAVVVVAALVLVLHLLDLEANGLDFG